MNGTIAFICIQLKPHYIDTFFLPLDGVDGLELCRVYPRQVKARFRMIDIMYCFSAQCVAQLRFVAPYANLSKSSVVVKKKKKKKKKTTFYMITANRLSFQIKQFYTVNSYNKPGNSFAFRSLVSIS